MKVFRYKNGELYTIEQRGWGQTITRPEKWDWWYAFPYHLNKDIKLIEIGKELDLTDFKIVFDY